jgi:hypothetical protein
MIWMLMRASCIERFPKKNKTITPLALMQYWISPEKNQAKPQFCDLA